MRSQPQLRRDLREVENELRLARNRLALYQLLDEYTFATHARHVVTGLETLQTTLTERVHEQK